MFETKPEILSSSEKCISLAQLSTFESISGATDYLVEKEVESVLRLSHSEQFKYLEGRLNIPFNKDLMCWPTFIEVTERRNLFVHTDGKVSTQYLTNCRDQGVKLDSGVKVGSKLLVEQKYFETALDCVLEIGVKLAHVVWRKLQPDDRELADKALNGVAYELICNEEYAHAIEIHRFGTEVIKTHSTEGILLFMRLNKAQAHKWGCEEERCSEIINSIDWTAKDSPLKLARSVLLDDFGQAADVMRAIGNANPDVGKTEYSEWPIFKEFRKSTEFVEAYHEVFDEDFKYIEKDGSKLADESTETPSESSDNGEPNHGT